MTRKAILSIVLLVVTGAGIFTWLGVGTDDVEGRPFRIAIDTWVGYGPFYVAQEKGYYDEEGLKVEIVKIEDEGSRRSAFASGDVQGAISTIDAMANGVAQGLPGKVVFKIDDSFGADGIVVKNGIRSIADLSGKTIAYPKGLPSHFFLSYLLDKNGLTVEDIKSRHMEAGDASAAFIANKVDAAVTWEPWLTIAGQADQGRILVTSKEFPGLIVDIFMVSEQTIKERPDDVAKLMRAWFKAIEFVKKNPAETAKIMARNLGIPEPDFVSMVAGIKFADYAENRRYFGITKGIKSKFGDVFNKAGKIWKREGIIETPVSAREIFEGSFLRSLSGI